MSSGAGLAPFDATQTNQRIDAGMASVVMLNSSCQAVIEAQIQQVQSPWYAQLDAELGQAENLVVGWRQGGGLYFQSEVLAATSSCAQRWLGESGAVDTAFAALKQHFDASHRQAVVDLFQRLQSAVGEIESMIGDYLSELQAFESQMETAHQAMAQTVAEVQAQEAQIQAAINSINAQIASLQQQIQTARNAIAQAESKRTSGIIETVFGVVFAPFTGGISLVLAGVGVASIAEAQAAIDSMQDQISQYQQTIAGDQATLTSDQQIVATLQALTMSTQLVLDDVSNIEGALDDLRSTWSTLDGELANVIDQLEKAQKADDLVLIEAWYDSACGEWSQVAEHVAALEGLVVQSTVVQIG
jgi:predicted  nucleic acid-binding Zn-ribbon protein